MSSLTSIPPETELSAPLSEAELRTQELRLRAAEIEIRREELRIKMADHARSRIWNPLVVAVLAGLIAALANIWATYSSGENALILEKEKWGQAITDKKIQEMTMGAASLTKTLTQSVQVHQSAAVAVTALAGRSSLQNAESELSNRLREASSSARSALTLAGLSHRGFYDNLSVIVDDVQSLEARFRAKIGTLEQGASEQTIKNFAQEWNSAFDRCLKTIPPRVYEAFEFARSAYYGIPPAAMVKPHTCAEQ